MKFGNMDIHILRDGYFRLDGGSMFGIVPKVLWKGKKKSDRLNRINLGLNSLIIVNNRNIILIETGIGDKYDRKMEEIYNIRKDYSLLSELKKIGLNREDVKYVILTHLHFDHSGGSTIMDPIKGIIPTFPRAKYIIQKVEYEEAINNNIRTKGSYIHNNFVPLMDYDLIELISGNSIITRGVSVIKSGGHTAGHQIVIFESEGKKGVFYGDIIPTCAHLKTNWIMSWDLYPLDVIRFKRKILEESIQGSYLNIWYHEDKIPWGYLKKRDNFFRIKRISCQ